MFIIPVSHELSWVTDEGKTLTDIGPTMNKAVMKYTIVTIRYDTISLAYILTRLRVDVSLMELLLMTKYLRDLVS